MFIVKVIEAVREDYVSKEWLRVADTGNPKDGGAVYEYVATDAVRNRETERYEQVVDTLDLQALVAVVNGLTK